MLVFHRNPWPSEEAAPLISPDVNLCIWLQLHVFSVTDASSLTEFFFHRTCLPNGHLHKIKEYFRSQDAVQLLVFVFKIVTPII